MMKNLMVANGQKVDDVTVYVAFPRRRAPFNRFALINLKCEVDLKAMSGIETKVLFSLLFSPNGLRLKDLALSIGSCPSSTSRAIRVLLEKGMVERLDRGQYRASRRLLHFGRWQEGATDEG